jgi:hypothetical protein
MGVNMILRTWLMNHIAKVQKKSVFPCLENKKGRKAFPFWENDIPA